MIEKIEKEDKSVMKEYQQLEVEMMSIFKKLYSTNDKQRQRIHGLDWGCILEKRMSWLERPFEEKEIKRAILECSKYRAFGPNRYNFAFFYKCREMDKEELLEMLCEFFSYGIINT